jgi:hypothetical protein
VFLMQIADRLAHQKLDDAERRVGDGLRAQVRRARPGQQPGPARPRRLRIALHGAAQRALGEYAEFQLDDDGPSYSFLRHLGFEIQQLMGQKEENRWVIDQVMDKDGWDAYKRFAKAFRDLFE